VNVKVIDSLSALPQWFRKRNYRKRLPDVEWFREIRRRQYLSKFVEMLGRGRKKPTEDVVGVLLEMLTKEDVPPDSHIYLVSQEGMPLRPMTVSEVIFLRFATRGSHLKDVAEEYDKLLRLWCEVLQERDADPDGPTPKFGQYEGALYAFFESMKDPETLGKF
jgi:hypothetical protein